MRISPTAALLRRAVAALVVATAVGVPALPATAGGPSAVLAGTTVISSDRSASMTVTMRTATSVIIKPGFASANFSVAGGGRYAGIVLSRDDEPGTSLIAAAVNFCGRPGCRPKAPATYIDAVPAIAVGGDGATRTVLPAGSYRLQLIADGAPVTVTMRLPGQTGRTHLTPRGHSGATVIDMTRSLPAGPSADSYFSAGTTHALAGGGAVLTSLVADRTASAGRQSGMCVYQGSGPPASVYLPECPNAFFSIALTIPEVAPTSTVHEYGGVLNIPGGTWSVGQYEATAGPTQVSIADGLWVPFN